MLEAKATGAKPGETNVLCLTNQITKDYIPAMVFLGYSIFILLVQLSILTHLSLSSTLPLEIL
jgi:hypothetical protein